MHLENDTSPGIPFEITPREDFWDKKAEPNVNYIYENGTFKKIDNTKPLKINERPFDFKKVQNQKNKIKGD